MHGHTIAYTITDSPLGSLLIGATKRGLTRIMHGKAPEKMIAEFVSEHDTADIMHNLPVVEATRLQLAEFFSGRRKEFFLPLDLSRGTAFQQSIWHEIARIPFGKTISYSQLAACVSKPKAVRASAHGCATNPVPLVIPCHRVVAKDGSLGGFGWGLRVKKFLLEMEQGAMTGETAAELA